MGSTTQDLDAICTALPEVEVVVGAGGRQEFRVPRGPKSKSFVIYRQPRKSAVDPATGRPWDDLIVVMVPDADTKAALVQDPATPFFTIDHFDGYNAVLVQESRLGEIERDRLKEIVVEAWATRAPAALARAYFEGGTSAP
jgi:hypothetical protein